MKVRLIDDGEAEACNDFHNRLYGGRRTIEQWRWDFASTIFEHSRIPYALVEDEGRIVGTQALIPIRMIDQEGVFWTAKSEETLVDPAYRGKKLFEKMYGLLFDYADRNGLACIWGFTPATKAFKRLGFSTPGMTSQVFFPFSTRSIPILLRSAASRRKQSIAGRAKTLGLRCGCGLARVISSIRFAQNDPRKRKPSTTDRLDLRTMEEPPGDAGEVCERFILQWGGTTIYRDAEYLRWRLFQNPYVKAIFRAAYDGQQLLGWIAYAMGDDGVGYLVDLFLAVDDGKTYSVEDVAQLLLREAVIGARNMGAVAIRGWRVNNHPFDEMITRVAKKLGFFHVRRGHAVVLFTVGEQPTRKSAGQFGDWFVSRIYTEGVLG